jgi:restriction system protein
MTRDDVPSYDKLLYATIKGMKEIGGSGTIDEIVESVIKVENFPVELQEIMHKDGRLSLIEYRLAWARTYLKKVNALSNSDRGIWNLTEYGRNITQKQCLEIPVIVRKEYAGNRKNNKPIKDEQEILEQINEQEFDWKERILTLLVEKVSPDAFERLCQRILRESGFVKVEVTGKSGDGGIDGIGLLRMNLVSFTVLFQCKKYKDSVGSVAVRNFRGAMQGRCDKGLIITTGTFTSEAKKEAVRDGADTIDLIDGDSLCDLLKNLRLGVDVQMVENITINNSWFEAL